MSEAFGQIFKKEIQEAPQKKEDRIVTNLLRMDEPVEKIAQASEWPLERVISFAKQTVITSLPISPEIGAASLEERKGLILL